MHVTWMKLLQIVHAAAVRVQKVDTQHAVFRLLACLPVSLDRAPVHDCVYFRFPIDVFLEGGVPSKYG